MRSRSKGRLARVARGGAVLALSCLAAMPGPAVAATEAAGPAQGQGEVPGADSRWWGRWAGTIEGPRETTPAALELRRVEDEARVRWTHPVANHFDLELPAGARWDGDVAVVGDLGLSLRFEGETLAGTLGAARVRLERVTRFEGPLAGPPAFDVPRPRLERLWLARTGGPVYASAVVDPAAGVALLGSTGGTFQAIDVETGGVRWVFEVGSAVLGTARLDGKSGSVFFVSDGGFLHRLNVADGKEFWRYDLGGSRVLRVLPHPAAFAWDWHAPRPLVVDDVVYVGSADGSFHAVDVGHGKARWIMPSSAPDSKVRGGAVAVGGDVVFGATDSTVVALDRASGKVAWTQKVGAPVEDEPWTDGTLVVVGTRGTGLHALDGGSGREVWRTTFWGSWVESTPALVDGVLHVGSSDLRRVSALSPEDGKVLWRTDVGGWSFGTPIVWPDVIIAASAGGAPYFIPHQASISILDRRSGRLLERLPLPEVEGAHQWGTAGSLVPTGPRSFLVTTLAGGLEHWRYTAADPAAGQAPQAAAGERR